MIAILGSILVANMANSPLIDQSAEELKKLQEEIQSHPRDLKKLNQYLTASQKLLGYVDAGGTLPYNSTSHAQEEWLENEGGLVKQEVSTAMNRLTAQLAAVLFPQEKAK
jgi:hypothetical protein